MESADDVEHIFFERIGSSFLRYTGCRIVEYTLLTATCRTNVTASIAADAAGQFAAPERKTLIRCHSFQLLYHIEAAALRIFFAILAQHFIINNNLMALAYLTALQQAILLVQLNIAIHGIYGYRITISGNAQNTLCARSTNGIRILIFRSSG